MKLNEWFRRYRLLVVVALLFIVGALAFAAPGLLFGPEADSNTQGSESSAPSTQKAAPSAQGAESPALTNPSAPSTQGAESSAPTDPSPTPRRQSAKSPAPSTVTVSAADPVVVVPAITVVPVTSVDIRWGSASGATDTTLIKGKSVSAVVADLKPANATNSTLGWTSSDPSVASVDSNGMVTGVSDGAAVITATAVDGSKVSDTLTVTVYTPITRIQIRYPSGSEFAQIKDTETITVSALITPSGATNQKVTWSWASSYYNQFATIDPDTGLITPIQGSFNGTVHLHPVAIVVGGGLDGANVRNSGWGCLDITQTYVTSIGVSLTESRIELGEGSQAAATISPVNATNQTYSWSSSDEGVVTIDADGAITSVGLGTARVTAVANDPARVSGWADIEVVPVTVDSVDIAWDDKGAESIELERGATAIVGSVTVMPSSAQNKTLAWSSSDEDVATVDADGVVYAVGGGSATITATTTDGTSLSDSVTVDVIVYPQYIWVFGANGGSIRLTDTETAQAFADIYPADATNRSVVWSMYSTYDGAFASIDPLTGIITPRRGTFTGQVHIHVKATIVGGGRGGVDITGTGCVDIYETADI